MIHRGDHGEEERAVCPCGTDPGPELCRTRRMVDPEGRDHRGGAPGIPVIHPLVLVGYGIFSLVVGAGLYHFLIKMIPGLERDAKMEKKKKAKQL
jgi:hypothetical protein